MAKTSKDMDGRAVLPPPEQMSYEAAMEEAQAITDKLDQGQISLEDSLAAFKRGMALLQRCRAMLDQAEQQVEQITAGDPAEGGSSR
jgi:exodeoxyribonuclease VII small subunit